MEKIRKQIDALDAEILRLLARRKVYARLVRDYKKEHGLPIRIPAREKVVFETRGALGKKLGLSPTFVKKLMTIIIAESRRNQK
jgi:chorismate mutase